MCVFDIFLLHTLDMIVEQSKILAWIELSLFDKIGNRHYVENYWKITDLSRFLFQCNPRSVYHSCKNHISICFYHPKRFVGFLSVILVKALAMYLQVCIRGMYMCRSY
jgi:hypothetical protein